MLRFAFRIATLAVALSAVATLREPDARAVSPSNGIHKIKHVIVVMQENRSFDSYFGTYPGADGIPMRDGVPQVCSPDPKTKECVAPYHDTNDEDTGAPHSELSAIPRSTAERWTASLP